jgi:hypothetical protein
LFNKIVNAEDGSRSGRRLVENSKRQIVGEAWKATVILFGVFQAEEITMLNPRDTLKSFLIAKKISQPEAVEMNLRRTSCPPNFFDVATMLPRSPHGSPQLFLFFDFTLRKYFKSRFSDNVFDSDDREGLYHSLASPYIFFNGEWSDFVTADCNFLVEKDESLSN